MAATYTPFLIPALASSGTLAATYKVYGWIPASDGSPTATPRTFYTDAEGGTPASNPATLGASSRLIYLNPALSITLVVKSSDDATTYATIFIPADLSSSGSASFAPYIVANNAALTALDSDSGLVDNGVYQTLGASTERDGGQGLWVYDSASTTTADSWTILAIDGGGAGRFFRLDLTKNFGTSGSPLSVDPDNGFVAMARTMYVTPGTGTAPATSTPDEVNVHMAAGSNGIGTGRLTRVYTDGTWSDGSESEAGIIGHAYEVYLTKGGVGFATSKYINVTTTTGSRPRGNETDFTRAVNYESLWGDIYITTGASDTGVASSSISFSGGGSVPAEGVRGVAATSSGGGFAAVDVIYKTSGGVEPIRSTGHIYVAGGGTCVSGLFWRYWTFTGPILDLPAGNIQLVSGNAFARFTGDYSGTHDDAYVSSNYDFVGAAVDSNALGTAAVRVRGVSGGNGEISFMTGAVNTAPSVEGYIQGGLVMGSPTGGAKGAGTINATAVYDDNVLLSCFVFDAALDGEINLAKWDSKVPDRVHPIMEELEIDGKKRWIETGERIEHRTHRGALKFSQRLGTEYDPLTLDGYAKHWKEKRHLTAFPNEARFEHGDMSTGEWMQRCIETLEIQAVLIEQLNQEIKLLKKGWSKQDQREEAQKSDLKEELSPSNHVHPEPIDRNLQQIQDVAKPYEPNFTVIPDRLAKYAHADESAEDFRRRAFSLLFRFGIGEDENFVGGGEPLTPDEKIKLLPMLIANFEAGNWLGLSEELKPD